MLRPVAAVLAVLAMPPSIAAPAHAANAYTPDGGPNVKFVGSSVVFSVDSTGQELDCPTFDLLGSVVDPGDKRSFGDDGLHLDELNAAGCTNPITDPVGYVTDCTWKLAVTRYYVGPISTVELCDVIITVSFL